MVRRESGTFRYHASHYRRFRPRLHHQYQPPADGHLEDRRAGKGRSPERLLSINPQAEITALQQIFTAETADSFDIGSYDYIIDAIDSLKDKALLILMATQTQAKFYSSMGAALKLDPTRIKTAEFWKVQGDPLARALRKRFKRDGQYPKRKFQCVYSDELLENKGHNATCGTEQCMCPKAKVGPGDPTLLNHEWCSSKAQINGTLAHITAIFGFMLAGLVIQDAVKEI